MNWIYKNIKININTDGKFVFNCCDSSYTVNSLIEAKEIIDEKTKEFYSINEEFYKNIIKKLNNKEAMFFNQLIEELNCHHNNCYCDLDIYNYLDFEIDNKVFELCKSKIN